MKEVAVPEIWLGTGDMAAAFDTVFGVPALRRMHGPSLTGAGPFDASGRRSFAFEIDVSDTPAPIRAFFKESKLKVTTDQKFAAVSGTRWEIRNRLKMHFVGSELFSIRPTFWLLKGLDGKVRLGGVVRHRARIPPPLNAIAETFMAANTTAQLVKFSESLAPVLSPAARMLAFLVRDKVAREVASHPIGQT